MPWAVTIRRADDAPLGDMDSVRERILKSLPEIKFGRLPSGAEKIAAARAKGVEFPEFIRQNLEKQPAMEEAFFEGSDFSVALYGFEVRPLLCIHAEVRGNGNPLPALAALCQPNGWIAIDVASDQAIDLTADAAVGWEKFRNYRDRAIESMKAAESIGPGKNDDSAS